MPFDSETQFGFKKVSAQEKMQNVFNIFKNVSKKYDVMNDVMSLGLHHYWKNELVNMVSPKPTMMILDAAAGTGDIALQLIKACKHYDEKPTIVVYDQNPHMLEQGKTKANNQGIFSGLNWIQGDAAYLPFPDCHFDAVTISFGLRNVTQMQQALKEFHRVLKPGGTFYCLEFSKPKDPLLKKLYHLYSFYIIPQIGSLIAKDKEAYQYLIESIEQFPDQQTLMNIMTNSGFEKTGYRNLTNGIVAIHTGVKPV